MPLTAITMLKVVFAATSDPTVGDTNLAAGILSVLGMSPMGVGLQEPEVICLPSVIVFPMQVLMKLLLEVIERDWPAVAFCEPSCSDPKLMTLGSRANDK